MSDDPRQWLLQKCPDCTDTPYSHALDDGPVPVVELTEEVCDLLEHAGVELWVMEGLL